MAVTSGIVSNSASNPGGGSANWTTASTTTANGDTLWIQTVDDDAPTSVNDNKGNVFTLKSTQGQQRIYVSEGLTGGPGGTPTVGGAGHTFSVHYASTAWCAVFAGWVRGVGPIDNGSINANARGGQPWWTGNVAFAQANNLLLAFVAPAQGGTGTDTLTNAKFGTGPAATTVGALLDASYWDAGVLEANGTFGLTGYSLDISHTNGALTGASVITMAFPEATSSGLNLTPGAGVIAVTGPAPTVARTANVNLTPAAGAMAVTGPAPSVAQSSSVNLTPAAGAIAVTGPAPTVSQSANVNLTPAPGLIAITGPAPTVDRSTGLVLVPPAGAIVVSGPAPSVDQTAHVNLTPDPGVLVMRGPAPTVTQAGPQADAQSGVRRWAMQVYQDYFARKDREKAEAAAAEKAAVAIPVVQAPRKAKVKALPQATFEDQPLVRLNTDAEASHKKAIADVEHKAATRKIIAGVVAQGAQIQAQVQEVQRSREQAEQDDEDEMLLLSAH